ncbi:MAG: hypothetical protein ACKOF3_10360, partial [Spartobacteria bacterium]
VLLLLRSSFPTGGVRSVLRVSCLPGCAPFAGCRCDSGFQTLTADCCALLDQQRRIRSGLLPRAGHTPATGSGLTSRRGLVFDQAVTSQNFHSERNIMKSFILAIALACAAVVGSVQAAGTSCPTCCKDKDCATCCKGKCSECKQCNK